MPVNGALAANPYKSWRDIDPSLPASPSLLFLPEKGGAMRDLFGDLILKKACDDEPLLEALADEAREEACLAPRESCPPNLRQCRHQICRSAFSHFAVGGE